MNVYFIRYHLDEPDMTVSHSIIATTLEQAAQACLDEYGSGTVVMWSFKVIPYYVIS